MSLRNRITQNLQLTSIVGQKKITKEPVFFLVGMVRARIIWSGETTEMIDVCDKIRIPEHRTTRLLLGQKIWLRNLKSELTSEKRIQELITQIERSFNKLVKAKMLNGRKFKTIKI